MAAAALALQGCESEYERHLRLSCHWDPNIRLKDCDDVGFRECIGHCEFCLGGLQTAYEGRDDECAQLKCGAYCARRSGDGCGETYRQLCEGAVLELRGCTGLDCSGATRAARPGLGSLLLGAAALAGGAALLPPPGGASPFRGGGGGGQEGGRNGGRGGAWTAGLAASSLAAAASLLLQGCGDACAPATPSIQDWQVDLTHLDRAAGCQDEWDWRWGNPCAYDVPVLFAKKGVERDADEGFLKGRVKNERHACQEWASGGYCQKWTSLQESCEAQDLAVCACTAPSNGSRYCHTWQCSSKRASQHLCREDCCGGACTPCVACEKHGSSRFSMNSARFVELAVAEGGGSSGGAEVTAPPSISFAPLSEEEALREARRAYWSNFDLGGTCFAARHVGSPAEVPCKTWREVTTGLHSCECQTPSRGAEHCHAWSCREGRAGMFSVLFVRGAPHRGLVESAGEARYECMDATRPSAGPARCRAWRGEVSGHDRVRTRQCRAACSASRCDAWACNEYELPRVDGGEGRWVWRLLLCLAHLCWMWLPLVIICRGRAKGACNALGLSPCGLLLSCFLIWAPAFLRWVGHESRWRAPGRPFLGLLLALGPAWVLAAVVWACGSERMEEWSPLVVVVPSLALVGLAWTSGVVAAGCLLGLLLLLPAVRLCCLRRPRRATTVVAAAPD